MVTQEKLKEIQNHKSLFNLLKKIIYKDIHINGICMRILGIHYMDTGSAWIVKPHKHSFHECHYVTENESFTTINGIEHQINAGSYYVIPSGTIHSHRQLNSTGHIGFALRWEIEYETNIVRNNLKDSKDLFDLISNIHFNVLEDDGTLLDGMHKFLKMAEENAYSLYIQTEFFQLVADIACKNTSIIRNPSETNRKFINDNLAHTAARFIEENYKQKINVNDVANSIHISYSQLSRIFRTHYGEPVNQYLNKIRIQRAQYLLKCTNKDVSVISDDVGFQNPHYFCDVFKKITGVSPGRYRRSAAELSE